MKPDAIEVGIRIKKIRTDLGYSMSQFGELISNSPKTTVNNWERGINLPKENKLKKISLLGKVTTNEILYGTPEEFISKIIVEHFRLQLNPFFLKQIIVFLEQQKIDLYDEMAIIEFIQGIVDSGSLVEHESKYLSYTPIVGSNNLYLASTTRNGEVIEPAFFVHVEKEKNRVHYLPYTFTENRNELYYNVPELNKQLDIGYYTRQFSLLDVELNQSTIVYYGIKEKENIANIIEYHYNNEEKIFEFEKTVNNSSIYEPFRIETEKTAAYLR
ncbi:helix-turn-helix domain-containing protein [Enterococcus malodoratus]|uniref:helix-turn-helix domain-containing protein n=1 Tax=Enterococcus malodoratus TaxID=71451 RepID=UPI0039AEAA80